MAICIAGLAVLYVFLDGTAANMPLVMLALAIFGVGQGLFISPNSSAIMATAPEELTGEAGSLLNVVRYLGISTGIAGASTLLALGIADAPGSNGITVDASAGRARLRQPARDPDARRPGRPCRRPFADANSPAQGAWRACGRAVGNGGAQVIGFGQAIARRRAMTATMSLSQRADALEAKMAEELDYIVVKSRLHSWPKPT